jgi:hypothetical protein
MCFIKKMAGFTVQGVPKCQGRKLQAIEFGRTFNIEESSRFIGISPTGCLIKPKTGNEALGKGRLKGQSLAAPFAPKNRRTSPGPSPEICRGQEIQLT